MRRLESSILIGWVRGWSVGIAAARGAIRSAARRRGRYASGLASGDLCSSLHHLISGRAALPVPTFRMLAARKPKDGTHLRGGCLVGPRVARSPSTRADRGKRCGAAASVDPLRLDHGPFGEEPGGEIAPQRHHQFARQGDDGDAPDAAARAGRAPKELAAERAVRLMSQPQPGELDRLVARARIARLADPLLAVGPSAAPRARREPDVAGDLAPIVEVLVEHLVGQCPRERRTETLEPA